MITASQTFRAIAEVVVPDAAGLDAGAWEAMTAIIERAVAQRPPKMQRQLGVFLRLLDVLSLLRHGRPLHRLDTVTRTRFLEGIQDSRLLLFRRGFWGVRTLVFMGYYARPEAKAAVGYRAHPRGWAMRV